MKRWLPFLLIFFVPYIFPYIVLRLPNVPQTSGRAIAVSIFNFGMAIAIFWFAFKSQMISPGAKLYEPRFDRVRPRIEMGIRFLVVAFGIFWLFLALPFGEDLFHLAAGEKPLQIIRTVKYKYFGSRGPRAHVGLSGENTDYELYYPTKALQIGRTYEFIILRRSRMILDYKESNIP